MRHILGGVIALLIGLCARAGEHRALEHVSVIKLSSSDFLFSTKGPSGWAVEDGQVLPPVEWRQSCSVKHEFLTGSDWNRFLAAELDFGNPVRLSEHRELFRIGGHTAVQSRHTDDSGKLVDNVYIDLSDLKPASLNVWRFRGDNTPAGQECEIEFTTLITFAAITTAR